ncbi:uncharacterized protein Fot_18299 [Forsythia ovata]|uniref:Uncharacterized protein n=1 Tax=Forsythia ovata TaxID=205694 RepID=A0ABD1VHW4_9LAMI
MFAKPDHITCCFTAEITLVVRLWNQCILRFKSSSTVVGILRYNAIVIKIDRSVFYESAESHKQTYSRIRLASASSFSATTFSVPRHRTPHFVLQPLQTIIMVTRIEKKEENSHIIAVLKQLFVSNSNPMN